MLKPFSSVQLFVTLWTVTPQAPLSMRSSKQEYWNGLPCLPPGDIPDSGIECLLCLLHWQVGSLPLSHLGSPGNQYSFRIAAIANYHYSSGITQYKFINLHVVVRSLRSNMVLNVQNSWQAWVFSGGSREELISFPFPVSSGQQFLGSRPPSSIFRTFLCFQYWQVESSYRLTPLLLPSSTWKESCDFIGLTWINPG